jgi:hypothetical protein
VVGITSALPNGPHGLGLPGSLSLLCHGNQAIGGREGHLHVHHGDTTMKQRNINARHLGLILRFPMTSIYTTGSN